MVFLDIEMPHMDGMAAAGKIREKDQALGIVFVTNMAQYAIHGYEVLSISKKEDLISVIQLMQNHLIR